MAQPTLLLAVHGTRERRGTDAARRLAGETAELTGAPVRLAFADVCAPDVGEVAAGAAGPLVVVPAFLAAGYHVGVDIPAQLARAGRGDAVVTGALGKDARLVEAAARRLRASGWRPGEAVVLAAAGSSDPGARAQVAAAARRLSQRLGGVAVEPGYVSAARPTPAEAVRRLRAAGHRRVAAAAWLLAPGLFHRRLHRAGADAVAAPLLPDPGVAAAVAARYREAAREAAVHASRPDASACA